MEADEIAKRIRHIHDIEIAMDESGKGVTPFSDAIRNAIPYMTPDEIRETLSRTLDKLDALYADHIAGKELFSKERETMEKEMSMLREQRLRDKESLAQKDREIESRNREIESRNREIETKDREIADLKKELAKKDSENVDANHKVQAMNRDKFQSKSKKGIDKKHETAKGRDDNKDDFDGTPESAAPDFNVGQEEAKPKVEKISKETKILEKKYRGKYTLADATECIDYPCDNTLLPEDAVIIRESVEIVFDEIRTVRAYRYGMVTYKTKEWVEDEDGNMVEKWVEQTKHIRKVKKTIVDEDGTEHEVDHIVEYVNGHMPDQIPNTKVSYRMLAMLLMQHLGANMPINRIGKMFKEFGFDVNRSTLGQWLEKGASLLEKAHQKLIDQILADNAVTYCDETWERLHLRDLTKKVYTWIIGNKKAKAVAYIYDDGSRGRDVLINIFKDRNIKAVHTDGYTAYHYLAVLGILQICCGAHLWRKIKEWYELTGDTDAKSLLLDLQWLYIQEAVLKEEGAPPEEVLRRRNSAETTEVITRFSARLELLKTRIDKLPKKGKTAVNYAINVQSRVFRWREDADYELDNNFAERAARPVALSRKTSNFNCSHRGAKCRAIIRSFIETCKQQGRSVINYLTAFFEAVCNGREDYENLLPSTIDIAR